MKKSNEVFLLHDDTDIHAFNQLTPEELELYYSASDLPQERMIEILLESTNNNFST